MQSDALSQRVGRVGKAVHAAWHEEPSKLDLTQTEATEQAEAAITELNDFEPSVSVQTDAIAQDNRTIPVVNLDASHERANGDR